MKKQLFTIILASLCVLPVFAAPKRKTSTKKAVRTVKWTASQKENGQKLMIASAELQNLIDSGIAPSTFLDKLASISATWEVVSFPSGEWKDSTGKVMSIYADMKRIIIASKFSRNGNPTVNAKEFTQTFAPLIKRYGAPPRLIHDPKFPIHPESVLMKEDVEVLFLPMAALAKKELSKSQSLFRTLN